MTHAESNRFSLFATAILVVALSGSACTTPVEEVAEAPGRSGQPVNTGTFPNLNIPRQAAATQFTDEEVQATLGHLAALRRAQGR